MACGNNKVSRSGLHTQPVTISPTAVQATVFRERAIQAAQRADERVKDAASEIARATSASSIRTAVQTAQHALDSARRAGGDRTKVRALEREVEKLRRTASDKTAEITHHELRDRIVTRDPLSRTSLGTLTLRAAPPPPPPANPPRDERITAAQKDLRELRRQIAQATSVERLASLRKAAQGHASIADRDGVARSDAQSVRDLLRALEQAAVERQSELDGPPVIHATSGEKGNWSSVLKKPPPDSTIVVDERIVYETDSLGRTARAQTVLSTLVDEDLRKEAQAWLRNRGQQAQAGGGDRRTRDVGGLDEGGHIFGTLFGGPGEAINLNAMDFEINRVSYRQLESIWEQQIKDGGIVNVSVDFQFNGDGRRPSSFDVTFDLDDGNSVTIPFAQ